MKRQLRQTVFPVLAALIWGVAFSMQARCAARGMGPFTFGLLRSVIGCAALFLLALLWGGAKKMKNLLSLASYRRDLLVSGAVCGTILFAATTLQQAAFGGPIEGTESGKVGFITALYIVLVPVLGVFLKRKASPVIWFCMLLAGVGMYFLCMKPGASLSITRYDLYALACSFTFALHILAVDRFASRVDGVHLALMQFATVALLSLVPVFLFEAPSVETASHCWGELLYVGVLSSGLGYTFQIMAQQNTNPTLVSLLFSLESVFAVLTGALLGERLTGREYLGCGIVLAAVVLSQLPFGRKYEKT